MVPEDLNKFDKEGNNEKFWCVHGIHRLEAMKKLNAMNKLKDIPGFPKDRMIICFILRVYAPGLTNYINIKANDLAAEHQSKASNESLFFVF